MQKDKRQRFQGLCLEAEEGWKHMSSYDKMPPDIRKRLRESPFNLCPACVIMKDNKMRQIHMMESMIRATGNC